MKCLVAGSQFSDAADHHFPFAHGRRMADGGRARKTAPFVRSRRLELRSPLVVRSGREFGARGDARLSRGPAALRPAWVRTAAPIHQRCRVFPVGRRDGGKSPMIERLRPARRPTASAYVPLVTPFEISTPPTLSHSHCPKQQSRLDSQPSVRLIVLTARALRCRFCWRRCSGRSTRVDRFASGAERLEWLRL
jgi:hypothetical protein